MSSGHRSAAGDVTGGQASVGAVVNKLSMEPGLRNFFARQQIVSRKFLVPYGAGRSMDGGMTYIDEGVPVRFKMGIEPDKYVAGHEGFEWWLMTRRGLPYWVGPSSQSAHWWATGYEHYLLKLDGYGADDIAAYEAEWLTYVSEDEAQRISPDTVPPDLYTGAYEQAEDVDPEEEQEDAKILPILIAARARLMPVREANLVA
jgi:hypothetical protein